MKPFSVPLLVAVITILLIGLSLGIDRLITPPIPLPSTPVQTEQPKNTPLTIGASVPNFTATSLTGQDIDLTKLQGKVVIINFWATWCAPCVVEFPMLIDMVEKYNGKLVLLAISSDQNRDILQKFLDDQAKNAPYLKKNRDIIVVHDDTRAITRDTFKVTTYPESLIIAPDGTLQRHIIGIDDWEKPDIQKLIASLLQQTKSPMQK